MKVHTKLGLGLLIAAALLFATASQSSDGNAATPQQNFIECPASLIAPYGGSGGWSTIQLQANFAKAVMDGTKMTCQYGFGANPKPVFGIQKPCPAGLKCVPFKNGFKLTP